MSNLNYIIMDLKNLFTGVNSLLFTGAVFFISFIIYAIYRGIKKIKNNAEERAQIENSVGFEPNDIGKYYKVIHEGTGCILLATNPSQTHPFGEETKWFRDSQIPFELKEEGKVFQIVEDKDGNITCERRPVF